MVHMVTFPAAGHCHYALASTHFLSCERQEGVLAWVAGNILNSIRVTSHPSQY